MNNLATRTISGVVFVLVIIAGLLLDKFVFAGIFTFIMIVMMIEFYRMTLGDDFKLSKSLTLASGIMLFLLVFAYMAFRIPAMFIAFSILPLLLALTASIFEKYEDFGKTSYLFTGYLYIAVPWALLNLIAFDEDGFCGLLILCLFVIIWGSDIGAYIFGSAFGQKHGKKLCPSISPKKSWIGFWGGMLLAIVIAVALSLTGVMEVPVLHCIPLAALMHSAGVCGDLYESRWKRFCDVKDSGKNIPGHGGYLDRFDSAIFAIPVGSLYLAITGLL